MIQTYLLRTLVMGGIDGIITIFNIISGIEGAKLNYIYIFILGLSTLIADAISMGTGEYLSVKADLTSKKIRGVPINKSIIPLKNGLFMFLSFVIFGMIPLVIYFTMSKINYKHL